MEKSHLKTLNGNLCRANQKLNKIKYLSAEGDYLAACILITDTKKILADIEKTCQFLKRHHQE